MIWPSRTAISWIAKILLTTCISLIGMQLCWNRSTDPIWVDREGKGITYVAGITADGRMVYLEADTQVVVREIATGKTHSRFQVQRCLPFRNQVTPDGKSVLLITDNPQKPKLLVVSLEDGQLRYPPISINEEEMIFIHPGSRFAIVSQFIRNAVPKIDSAEVVDLQLGKVLWRADSALTFVGTDDSLVLQTHGVPIQEAQLRSTQDGQVIGPLRLPALDEGGIHDIKLWPGNRLFLSVVIPSTGGGQETRYHSAVLAQHQLSDLRPEPAYFRRKVGPGREVSSSYYGHLEITDLFKTPMGWAILKDYQLSNRIGLNTTWSSQQYRWQPVIDGIPAGPAI